mgnify:CR=1 FL=1
MSTKQLPALPSATTAEDDDLLLKRDDASGSDQGLKISTLRALAFGDAAGEDFSVTATPNTLAKRDGVGRIQAASGGSGNETVVHNDTNTDPNADTIAKRDGNGRVASAAGGSGTDAVVHDDFPDSGLATLGAGVFVKADTRQVAWTKTGNGTAETSTALTVEVDGGIVEVPSGTNISMPSLSAGTDYAIWVAPDGTLEADASFSTAPTAGGRRVGGFHYAPGGNASFSLNAGDGGTTAQINEYSFYDLKWRPSVADPRGLTLVNESFWTGMYLMSANTTVAPLHKYNVEPARDGNNPQKPYGDGTTYGNAKPMNVFECLSYYGFRAPDVNEFQLLALGVNEERSIGGSGPGNTGDVTDRSKDEQTSAWGVFDATGVLNVWGRDSLPDNNQDSGVTEGRSDNRFRISRFAGFGGSWVNGSSSGSRFVNTNTATISLTGIGGVGVCDHLILD